VCLTPCLVRQKNYNVFQSGSWADITPIRYTSSAGDATFVATNGSTILTVTDAGHGAIQGDFVTFSDAVSLGGVITADVLNQEFEVTEVLGSNSYTITSPVAANASDTSGGGAATIAAYQINIGADVSYFDFGWGTGTWNLSTWGTPRPASAGLALLSRVWQFDNYGEDLICQLVNGGGLPFGTPVRAQVPEQPRLQGHPRRAPTRWFPRLTGIWFVLAQRRLLRTLAHKTRCLCGFRRKRTSTPLCPRPRTRLVDSV